MLSTQQDDPAIRADALVKTYGDHRALDGFDLEVATGTVQGLLGPNGAGKTTAVRILATLLRADGGSARVAGADVATQADLVRHRIALSGQEPAVDEILSGAQNVRLFARLFGMDKRSAARRADELLEQLDLVHAADRPVKKYSGGMRRRLDLAVTLIQAPAVLFLDEPTTGLDPRSRAEVWDAVRAVVATGTTVLLTTQYLDEADQLADQIAVMDKGRVIAQGTSDELKATVGGDLLEVVIDGDSSEDLDTARRIIESVAVGTVERDDRARRIGAPVEHRARALADVVTQLAGAGVAVADVGVRRPTLDDVFLTLTGHRADPGVDADTDSEAVA